MRHEILTAVAVLLLVGAATGVLLRADGGPPPGDISSGGAPPLAVAAIPIPARPDTPPPMRFGLDAASIDETEQEGLVSDHGTLWIGAWSVQFGWAFEDRMLWQMREEGITPVIQLYYWGDDISQDCVQNGCWSDLHSVYKDRDGWDRVIEEMGWHLQGTMRGEPVVVVLESEFNKADLARWEPLDRMLAERAAMIRDAYPAAEVVLGLGNWQRGDWATWDRAAAASDAVGVQAVHAVDAGEDYDDFYEEVLESARYANVTFGRPVWIHDIAFSSYEGQERAQAGGLQRFFDGLEELQAAGVQAMIYRSWEDTPGMDIDNTFGPAERHWGLVREDGTPKPARDVWLTGVLSTRTAPVFDAQFDVTDAVNGWWVEVVVEGSNAVTRVDAIIDGAAQPLQRTAWGTWAASVRVEPGADVAFVAQDILGREDRSDITPWPQA